MEAISESPKFHVWLYLQIQDEGRTRVRNTLTPSTAQTAVQRIIPFPCKKQYTVVILMPQSSRLNKLNSFISSRDAKVNDSICFLVDIVICTELRND